MNTQNESGNTSRIYLAVTIFAMVAAIGVIIGTGIAFVDLIRGPGAPAPTLPSETANPATSPTPGSQVAPPTAADAANWAVSYQYAFPAGTWANGEHQYTLEASCPFSQSPAANGKWTNSFMVSTSASKIAGTVYLQASGAFDANGNSVSEINFSQATAAIVTFSGVTQSDAQQYATGCQVTVKPDNGTTYPLAPGAPFQP